jgi:hypothetical protein
VAALDHGAPVDGSDWWAAAAAVERSPEIREVLMFCTEISVQNIRTCRSSWRSSLISGDSVSPR